MSCLYVREEIRARETQDKKVKIMPLCHFCSPLLFSNKCAHTLSFSFSTLWRGDINTTSKSMAATPRGGMLNRNDLSSVQEGSVSTPETCPRRTGSLFSCFVMVKTPCWHHTKLCIFWVMQYKKEKRKKSRHQQGILFGEQKVVWTWLMSPPPSGQMQELQRVDCISQHQHITEADKATDLCMILFSISAQNTTLTGVFSSICGNVMRLF